MKKVLSVFLSLVMLFSFTTGIDFSVSAYNEKTTLNLSEFPDYPYDGQKYWIVFNEGFRDGRIEMSTCNIKENKGENPYILWDDGLYLQNADVDGEYNQYYYNDNEKWEYMLSYDVFSDYAIGVIASNLDVYDISGNLIVKGNDIDGYGISDTSNNNTGQLNGHSYKVFDIGLDWYEAKKYCENLGGHLATITSKEENDYISSMISVMDNRTAWIGGYCENDTWKWVTGEKWTFSNWDDGEPNNYLNRNEDKLLINKELFWNDQSAYGDPTGVKTNDMIFICEWDSYIYDDSLNNRICLANLECVDEGHYTGNMGDARVYKLDATSFYGYEPFGYDDATKGNGNVGLDGTVFTNGFEVWIARWNFGDNISWAYRVFKLDSKFNTLTGSIDLIKSYNTDDFDSTLYIYNAKNNELLYSFNITPNNYKQNFSVNVKNVDELKVEIKDNLETAGGTSFALYDLFLDNYQMAPNGFALGKDNNKFRHNNGIDKNGVLEPYDNFGFYNRKNYSINDRFIEDKLYDLARNDGTESLIRDHMNEEWAGSCYGLAATIGLAYNNTIDINSISSFYTNNYYGLKYPYENPKLDDAINFYYLSQFLNDYGTNSDICTVGIKDYVNDNECVKWWNSYIFKDYFKLLINDAINNKSLLLGYFRKYYDENEMKTKTSGHAIITCGVSQLEDETFDIWLYNENCRTHFDHLLIKFIGNKVDMKYKCNDNFVTLSDEIYIMYHMPLDYQLGNLYPIKECDKIDTSTDSEVTTVVLNANCNLELNNVNEENIISLNEGELSSNKIKDIQFITGSRINQSDALYKVGIDKCDSLIYDSKSQDTDISMYDNNDYVSIKGKGIGSIEFNDLNDIKINGSQYYFDLSINRDVDDENQLVSISGTAESDLEMKIVDNEICLSSDNEITDIDVELFNKENTIEYEVDDTFDLVICDNNHEFRTKIIPPNCDKDGYTKHQCEKCGYVCYDDYISALGHKQTSQITKATSVSNGAISYICSVCGIETEEKKVINKIDNISLSTTKYTYDGKVKKPSITVKDGAGKVISSSNYNVTYSSGRKNIGKYTVKITFKGNYTGTVSKTFTIVPKSTSISKLTAVSKGITVKWKKQTKKTTGYQIQIATDSKFSKNKKSYTISKNSIVSKKIKKLKAKKKYYVRIRTYKTVSGKKYYSFWSSAKAVTTKK